MDRTNPSHVITDFVPAADGSAEVPSVADADRIGWYNLGVTPGETGPAVLIGHFDTVKGPAVLKDVAEVRVGARPASHAPTAAPPPSVSGSWNR
ncbi:hypothetical protein [Streptomyces sp. NPDC002133]|uniref:hypothetical protein n=1 Tax=Streptomyces sp. NPDC002133 TaxID=3154409 RepID=UPI003316B436